MIYDRIINVSCVSLTPLGRVFKIRHFFLHVFSADNARAESPKAPSPGQAKRHPGLRGLIALTPCKGKSILYRIKIRLLPLQGVTY